MRRLLAIVVVVLVALALVILVAGSSSGSSPYLVRGYFDTGSYIVPGEDVRVAGAIVGSVESVDVSMPGEVDSLKGGPHAIPGKAVVVMKVDDPGFQDFRRDASCLIRPPSLIGERYVDCRPTLPRGPATPPPPSLQRIPSGHAGAGQYLLPFENNGVTVDPDLINNLSRLPYADRFRLILNELGAGLAARGGDLAVIVRRADPALRDTDRLLRILAGQRHQLAKLAQDSVTILGPLSRARRHLSGFISNAGVAAQVTAEQGPALQASLAKFPRFLTEFRTTMRRLQGFSNAAEPVAADLGVAAPSLTAATKTLTPFSQASAVALKSLGKAGVVAGPTFRAADPIVRKAGALAKSGVRPLTNLAKFLVSTKKTKGFEGLMGLIYNFSGALNGYDSFGHFLRAVLVPTNCVDYTVTRLTGCEANFNHQQQGQIPSRGELAKIARLDQGLPAVPSNAGGVKAPTSGGPAAGNGQNKGGGASGPVAPPSNGQPSTGAAQGGAVPTVPDNPQPTPGLNRTSADLLHWLLGP